MTKLAEHIRGLRKEALNRGVQLAITSPASAGQVQRAMDGACPAGGLYVHSPHDLRHT